MRVHQNECCFESVLAAARCCMEKVLQPKVSVCFRMFCNTSDALQGARVCELRTAVTLW